MFLVAQPIVDKKPDLFGYFLKGFFRIFAGISKQSSEGYESQAAVLKSFILHSFFGEIQKGLNKLRDFLKYLLEIATGLLGYLHQYKVIDAFTSGSLEIFPNGCKVFYSGFL